MSVDLSMFMSDQQSGRAAYYKDINNSLARSLADMLYELNVPIKIVRRIVLARDKALTNENEELENLCKAEISMCQTLHKLPSANKSIIKHMQLNGFENAFRSSLEKLQHAMIPVIISTLSNSLKSSKLEVKNLKEVIDNAAGLGNESTARDSLNNLQKLRKVFHKKTGSYWTAFKTALGAVIGLGCIVVGVIGLVPSLGGSIGLVFAGSLLCSATGVAGFKKLSAARKTAKEIDKMIEYGLFIKGSVKHTTFFANPVSKEQEASELKSDNRPPKNRK